MLVTMVRDFRHKGLRGSQDPQARGGLTFAEPLPFLLARVLLSEQGPCHPLRVRRVPLQTSTYFPWLVKNNADGTTSINFPGLIGMFLTVVVLFWLAKKLPVTKNVV